VSEKYLANIRFVWVDRSQYLANIVGGIVQTNKRRVVDMTKKDYQKIVNALALAACDNAGRGGTVTVMDDISFVTGAEQAAIRLALALADDDRFDAAKFYRAFDLAVAARRRFLANKEVA